MKFEDVTFSYRDDLEILTDISFSIDPGEVVALVGATGSGKQQSQSLTRMYDGYSGAIIIDGQDISTVDPKVFATIGVISQDAFSSMAQSQKISPSGTQT